MKADEICEKLNIDYLKILNIYKYGSKVYGTDDEYSDSDYIIVSCVKNLRFCKSNKN